MTAQTPTIRTADKDDEGPAKRRRRPALSCVECRNRKVRCDRRKPCGACTQIRSTTCTYRPSRPGIHERCATSISASGSNDPDHDISARSSPQPVAPSNQFDAMVNRYVAPGIFGEHDKPQLKPLPTGRPGLNLTSHSDGGDSALVSHLLKRIDSLESERAAREGKRAGPDLSIREGSDNTTGRFVKSKFYGQSHWVNALEPVRILIKAITSSSLHSSF
jgi:hypothetical protein